MFSCRSGIPQRLSLRLCIAVWARFRSITGPRSCDYDDWELVAYLRPPHRSLYGLVEAALAHRHADVPHPAPQPQRVTIRPVWLMGALEGRLSVQLVRSLTPVLFGQK